jgi:hypothetical protein
VVIHVYNKNRQSGMGNLLKVQVSLSKNMSLYPEKYLKKKGGGMALVEDLLPIKCNALISHPGITNIPRYTHIVSQ